MDELIEFLLEEIPKAFNSEEYEKEKAEIIKRYQTNKEEVVKKMKERAKELGFGVKVTNSGIYFLPLIDGEAIDESEYDALNEEIKDRFSKVTEEIQDEVSEIVKVLRDLEKKAKQEIEDLEYKIGLFAVGHHISALKEKYKEFDRVNKYLEAVQEDLLENIEEFLDSETEEEDQISSILPFVIKKNIEDVIIKYRVNLFIDNTDTKGAPVIIEFNPTYNKLIGQIEYDNEFGNLTTDFTKIKPGLFHQANGGYLILQAMDVLTNTQSWEAIKVLKTKKSVLKV